MRFLILAGLVGLIQAMNLIDVPPCSREIVLRNFLTDSSHDCPQAAMLRFYAL